VIVDSQPDCLTEPSRFFLAGKHGNYLFRQALQLNPIHPDIDCRADPFPIPSRRGGGNKAKIPLARPEIQMMFRLPRPALMCRLAAAPLLIVLGAGAPPVDESRSAAVVARVVPAVVNISVWRDTPHKASPDQRLPSPPTRERSFGSGFVIDQSGIIVTNKHVVEGADTITVGFEGDRRYRAHVLVSAVSIDLALLKIEPDNPLPVAEFGDSDALRAGQPVLAIGNPLSVGISVTSGVVSALNRDIHDTPFDDYIQTDASTNPGSSGGPLIDMDGKVIGIDTAYLTGSTRAVGSIGIAFALPSSGAQFVIGRLLKYGSVRAGWLGLQVQKVTPEMAEAMALPHSARMGATDGPAGLIVTSVEPGEAAAKAGIVPGDVIYALDGEAEDDPRALLRNVGRIEVGKTATLDLWRGGKMTKVAVVVEEWPAEMAPPPKPPIKETKEASLGLSLQAIMRTTDGAKAPVDGVVVTNVDHESTSMYGGIEVGDVILKVLRQDVSTPDQVFAAFDQARAEHRRFVSMLIRRQGKEQWTTLPL
jgi:serine protease Do